MLVTTDGTEKKFNKNALSQTVEGERHLEVAARGGGRWDVLVARGEAGTASHRRKGTDLECCRQACCAVHFVISSDFLHNRRGVIPRPCSACRAEDVFPHRDGK